MCSSKDLLLSPSEIHELLDFHLTVEIFHKTSTRRQIIAFDCLFSLFLGFYFYLLLKSARAILASIGSLLICSKRYWLQAINDSLCWSFVCLSVWFELCLRMLRVINVYSKSWLIDLLHNECGFFRKQTKKVLTGNKICRRRSWFCLCQSCQLSYRD